MGSRVAGAAKISWGQIVNTMYRTKLSTDRIQRKSLGFFLKRLNYIIKSLLWKIPLMAVLEESSGVAGKLPQRRLGPLG